MIKKTIAIPPAIDILATSNDLLGTNTATMLKLFAVTFFVGSVNK
jgi:hypothetical protein